MKVLAGVFGGVWVMAAGRRSLAALSVRLAPSPTKLKLGSRSEGGVRSSVTALTPSPQEATVPAWELGGSSEMVLPAQRYQLSRAVGKKQQGSKRKLDFDAVAGGLPGIVKQEVVEEDKEKDEPKLGPRTRRRTLRNAGNGRAGVGVPAPVKGSLQRVEAGGKRKRFTSVPSSGPESEEGRDGPGKVPRIGEMIVKEEAVGSEEVEYVKPVLVGPGREPEDVKPMLVRAARELVFARDVGGGEVLDSSSSSRRARTRPAAAAVAPVAGSVVLAASPPGEEASGVSVYNGPYPNYCRPYAEECREVAERLYRIHGSPPEFERHRRRSRVTPTAIRDGTGPNSDCRTDGSAVLALSYLSDGQSGVVDGSSAEAGCSGVDERSWTVDKLEYSPEDRLALSCVLNDEAVIGIPSVQRSVLDSLVGTILSQNTTDSNSSKAFHNLKKVFPTWEEVQRAEPAAVADAIRCAGLAATKGQRIQTILTTLLEERGKICLEHLRHMSEEAIKAELGRFKGVGPKTVACVLMFHLQRDEFPVDTHVFRISKMLGWVPPDADRERTYLHLNERIPNHLKFDLHCMFVTHGRSCPHCAAGGRPRKKSEGPCPLLDWTGNFLSRKNSATSCIEDDKAAVKLIKNE